MLNSDYREVSDQLYCAFSEGIVLRYLFAVIDNEAFADRNKLCLKVAARKAARYKYASMHGRMLNASVCARYAENLNT